LLLTYISIYVSKHKLPVCTLWRHVGKWR